ncbi:hypothetical protein [Polymorphospora rubra]|uniref:Uncharacterized protein n=1 Tax=Polymorphospora rubra TaxID=338584 RepID=A0A810MX28_9ACTN|nr:hypothetical protein [Polymorphospora rubra]BCJ65110.1 hypothetical protein Prubr_21310 [Polymorphospora rubra]
MNPNTIALAAVVVALFSSILALLGAIFGPWLQARQTAKHANQAWQRDLRVAVYLEAAAHAQRLESWMQHISDPTSRPFDDIPELPHRDLVAAKIRVLAPLSLYTAWTTLHASSDAIKYVIEATTEASGSPQDMPWNHPAMGHLQEAINDVIFTAKAALRAATS